MAELHIQHAKDRARTAMGYVRAFEGRNINWQSPDPWPHRIELAQALEWIEELSAMTLNLAARIAELEAERDALKVERDEWAAKWHAMRRQYGEMRWPGMTRVVTASDAAMNQPKDGQ